jgi:metal-responsive CopG/Arc/MetJ family transcriptional regulator
VVILGRKRSTNKHIPMSLSIPYSLVIRLDKELSFKQSRSNWVQGAIKAKLDQTIDFEAITSKQLLVMLANRNVITPETLRVMLQSVETEE